MAAIGWVAIENALTAWALAGSGLASGQAIWSYPGIDAARPEPPYIALSFSAIHEVGHAWEDREFPEDPDEGAEIKRLHRNAHVATLSLQLFADSATGETGAMARMHDTLAALDVYMEDLDAAGIGIGNVGAVTLVAGRRNTLLEPRAVAEVELHLISELVSYVTYVATVQLKVTADPAPEFTTEVVVEEP